MKIIIEHGIILTMNEENQKFYDGFLCIDGKKIVSVGERCPEEFVPDKIINGKGCIVMPGLVNAHCHSPMTMFRNFAGGLPLQTWLFQRIRPLQQYVTQKEIEACAKLAYMEMIKSGTTAFGEMYAWADVLAELTAESGLKALITGKYGKDLGLAGITDKEQIREHSRMLQEQSDGRVREGLMIHSLYAAAEDAVLETAEFAAEEGLPVHIHVSETKTEMEQIYEKYRMSPVQKLAGLSVFDTHTLAAHCVYLDDDDIEILNKHHVNVVHCPVSNLKLGSGIADIHKMTERGVNVCIGTDGASSNNNLNLFKEFNIAALLGKGTHCDPTVLPAEQILRMATENGCRALGIEKSGRLECGWNADLIMVSTREPHFTPLTDPYDALVYSAQAGDVMMTMTDGRILMENRELKGVDEEKILAEAQKAAETILSFDR